MKMEQSSDSDNPLTSVSGGGHFITDPGWQPVEMRHPSPTRCQPTLALPAKPLSLSASGSQSGRQVGPGSGPQSGPQALKLAHWVIPSLP